MLQSFLIATGSYSRNYLYSFWPGRHPAAPLGPRRLLFLTLFPLFLLVQLLHWVALALDELLYPAYRLQRIDRPVFITGIPRSGTTYLHRLLASGSGFTTVTTWEALLAPAICQRRLIGLLAGLDERLGGPLRRALGWLLARVTGDFASVHAVGLGDAEEDYLCLLPAAGCFLLLMAFPFDRELERLGTLDTLPARRRVALLAFYHRMLQRHCFCHPGARFLSKNAAFAGWPAYLAERYPDAAFILCVRQPGTALASQLSALRPARRLFGTDPEGGHSTARFRRLYGAFLERLADFAAAAPARLRVLEQHDLRSDPKAVAAALGTWLGVASGPLPPAEATALHRYRAADFGLDPEDVERELGGAYNRLLASPARLQVAT
jgi:omega-hydroxy-beta-dihydromenaquinone-9 sulfotransferase